VDPGARAVTAAAMRDIVGLGGIELALAAVGVAICGAVAGRRGAPWGLLVAAVAMAPIGGIPLAGYVRGVTGDLSVPTLALLAAALFARLSPRPLLDAADRGALHAWAAAVGVVLYPLTLGLTRWDPYALGYRPRVLLLVAAALVIAWWRRRRGAALVLAAGVAAFGMGLMESTNLWDYLVDPAVATWAVAVIVVRSPAGRRVALLLDRVLSGMRAARARRTDAPSPAGPRR
jgi:hypothetical protein